MAVPEGWTDVDETLAAPGGNKVVLGFRAYILTHDWQADDVPLEDEHADGDGAEAGTAQLFACTRLRYTRARGVYKDDLGRQLQAAWAQIVALQAQLAQEQAQAETPGDGQRAAIRAVAAAAAQLDAAFPEAGGAHAG